MNNPQLNREKLVQHYLAALERGDMDGLTAILEQAQHDPMLSEMIVQVHGAYETETVVSFVPLNGSAAHLKAQTRSRVVRPSNPRRPYRFQGFAILAIAAALTLIAIVSISAARNPSVNSLATPIPIALDSLQPITAENVSQIRPIMTLGRGGVVDAAVAPDGQTIAFARGESGIELRSMSDLNAPPRPLVRSATTFYSIVYSDDSTLLAGIHDSSVWLWNATTGEVLLEIDTRDSWLSGVFIRPDNRQIAAIGCAGTTDNAPFSACIYAIHIWDVASGKLVKTLNPTAQDYISNWTFNHDWSLLLFSDINKTQLFDVASGTIRTIQYPNSNGSTTAAFSPDGTLLAASGNIDHGVIRIWKTADLLDADPSRIPKTPPVTTINTGLSNLSFSVMMFSPDGNTIFTGDYYGRMNLWDVASGKWLMQFDLKSTNLFKIALLPDRLVTITRGVTVQFWDITTGKEQARYTLYDPYFMNVLISSDSTRLIASGQSDPIRLWNLTTTPPEEQMLTNPDADINQGQIGQIAFSPDEQTLAYTFGNIFYQSDTSPTTFWLHDLETGEDNAVTNHTLAWTGFDTSQLSFADDQTLLSMGVFNRQLMRVSIEKGAVDTIELGNNTDTTDNFSHFPGSRAVYYRDKNLVAVAICLNPYAMGICEKSQIRLFDAQTGAERARLLEQDSAGVQIDEGNISNLALSSDGRLLAAFSCSTDPANPTTIDCQHTRVSLWDVGAAGGDTAISVSAFASIELTGYIDGLAFSPGENPLLAFVYQEKIQVYQVDTTTKTITFRYAFPQTDVGNLIFFRDGSRLLMGTVGNLTFSHDGRLLLMGANGVIQVWGVPPG
jgi:WD40 repeat protein